MHEIVAEDPLYANVDDYRIANALISLRGALEHELVRHSWLSQSAIMPAVVFAGANVRAIAIACDGRWGDIDACRGVLSPELYRELLRIVADPPTRGLDWTMRALSLCLNTPVRSTDAAVESLLVAKQQRKPGGRRRAA
ncbi:MAG TPA: hypothetical protein VM513_33245 [Kofleriaceae bacterium]|jgi:hypothetical protein|nr:hypothetical protein [Kofleriaceae bacterium]